MWESKIEDKNKIWCKSRYFIAIIQVVIIGRYVIVLKCKFKLKCYGLSLFEQ